MTKTKYQLFAMRKLCGQILHVATQLRGQLKCKEKVLPKDISAVVLYYLIAIQVQYFYCYYIGTASCDLGNKIQLVILASRMSMNYFRSPSFPSN
jgi:hypothetical protein